MAGSTITGTLITSTVTLGSGTYASPLTVASDGTIQASGTAIYGPSSGGWVVNNYGTVKGGYGIRFGYQFFGSGGSVTNSSGALIQGTAGAGVRIDGQFGGNVANSGTILASAARVGVYLFSGGTVTNSAGLIDGGGFGVFIARSSGLVTNDATIIGDSSSGVLVTGGVVTNSATALIEGAEGVHSQGFAGVLSNAGTVLGTTTYGARLVGGGSVTNTGTGLIKGTGGVYIVSGAVAVSNAGTILGTSTNAIRLNSASGGGYVSNAATGLIQGTSGVFVTGGAGSVVNAGTIVGTTGNGVTFQSGGVVTNSGTGLIEGLSAVNFAGAASTVVNSGTLVGNPSSGRGAYLDAGGSVANNGGLIEGNGGVDIENAAGTVTNSGTIAGTGSVNGISVFLNDGGSVDNTATTSLITGINSVVINNADGTVTNYGTIIATSTSANGVELGVSGIITNTGTDALIRAAVGIMVYGTAGTVSNSGTIIGTLHTGVQLSYGGSAGNSGLIEGGALGVHIQGGAGTVANSGTISGNTTSYQGGIAFFGGGTVANTGAGALIQAYGEVVYIGIAAGTVINSGTIIETGTASGRVIDLAQGGSVYNSGLMQGFTGIYVEAAGATITNYGVIAAALNTAIVGSLSSPLTIFNSGTIAAGGNNGIGARLEAGGYLSNADSNALITGGHYGVALYGAGGLVTNSGTIVGTGAAGVYLYGGTTLIDAGMISGGGGTAVYFGGIGSNLLVLEGGYALSGIVVGSSSAGNALELGSVTGDGTVSAALPTEFVNFATITVDAGANWTLTGNSYLGGGVTLTDFGTLTNNGTLGSPSLVIDTATLINGGSIATTVFMTGGGYLKNTGAIEASTIGAYAVGGETVFNSGTIGGTSGDAVKITGVGTVGNSGIAALIRSNTGIAVLIESSGGIVTNSGTIDGTGGVAGTGVDLNNGGSVGNTGGLIGGHNDGVYIRQGAASVSNSGTITGLTNDGILLKFRGYASNVAGGLVQGYNAGIEVVGAGLSLSNAGVITGTTAGGVQVFGSGNVTNTGTGTIQGGHDGVYVQGAVTVANSGTVAGGDVTGFAGVRGGGTGSIGNTGLIDGYNGIILYNGIVTNSGTIIGTSGSGIHLSSGGSVTNSGTGRIEGSSFGIYIKTSAGIVSNDGTIIGNASSQGIEFAAGGSIGNTGLIQGYGGIVIYNAVGTVTNSGTIDATNAAGFGIGLAAGGTIIDSGTIAGNGGPAIVFGGTLSNLLVVQNGYHFVGAVDGSVTAGNTVALNGSAGSITVDYNALNLSDFSTVLFGANSGNSEILKITNVAALPGTVSGFVSSLDTIDITGLLGGTVLNGGSVNGLDQLVISNGVGTVTLQLDSEDYSTITWTASSDGSVGTDIALTPVCYCRGTRILTPAGEVAVEDLRIGDAVVTFSGVTRPVKWIGRRAYDGRFVAGNRGVLPVRITASALADGVPARDLRVSPGHALYLDGVLVRAEHLVNGATIVQEEAVERLEYFHVELATHDILIADGAPAESYADCDNRAKFHNAAEFASLYPGDDRPRWQYCAPLLDWSLEGSDAVRARLLARAEALGHRLDLDPGLHLVADGAVIRPACVEHHMYRFVVPAGSTAVALASRSVAPAEVEAGSRDQRCLGVPIERIALYDGALRIAAGHGHAGLATGFHEDEPTHRWTDGFARLPAAWLGAFPGGFTLEVQLFPSGLRYRLPAAAVTAA